MAKSTNKRFAYRIKEVQEAGNNLLRTTINELRFHLPNVYWKARNEEDQGDKGIDFQYELEDKNTGFTITIFKIQNKGTEKELKPLKRGDFKGLISFQIQLRNAIYYRQEIPTALIFTLSDVRHDKVYWHSVQLDDEIDISIENAINNKRKSIQIYVDPKNILSADTAHQFLKDIYKSFEQQTERHKIYASKYGLFQISEEKYKFNTNDSLIEQVYKYFKYLFSDLNILPIHLIKNNYPFKNSDDFYSHYSLFSMTTDNDELFELFESIKIENGDVSTSKNKFTKGTKDSSRKLKYILKKLTEHLIFNIYHKKSNLTISISYPHIKSCDCIKCCYGRLNYVATIKGLQGSTNNEDRELIAYMNYEMGNLTESAKQFTEIGKVAKRNHQVVSNAIAQFNLAKLYVLIKNTYWTETTQPDLLEHLKNVDTEKLYYDLKSNEKNKLIDWVLNAKFYTSKRDDIYRTVIKIKDHYHTQLRGGWSSNSHIGILINEYAEIEQFINGNLIVYNKFIEYQELTSIFIEGLFVSHAINENQESRLEKFDDWLFFVMLFNGRADRILELFNRYGLKSLKYKQSGKSGNTFLDAARNHFTLYTDLYSTLRSFDKKSASNFWEKYTSIFHNLVTLLSLSNINSIQTQELTDDLLGYLKDSNLIEHFSIRYIELYIKRKGAFMTREQLYKFLLLFLNDPTFHENSYIETITKKIFEVHGKLDLSTQEFDAILTHAFDKCPVCDSHHSTYFITKIFQAVQESNQKSKIQEKLNEKLNGRFDPTLYYAAALDGLYTSDSEYFNQFFEAAKPNGKTVNRQGGFGGTSDYKSRLINMFLNLCFMYDIDLKAEKYSVFRGIDDYYDWLLDMENFDYSNFNPHWTVEYTYKYYIKHYRKHPIIKEKVVEYLSTNHDLRLQQLLIKLS